MIKLLASLEEVLEAVLLTDRSVSQFIDADTGELLFFAGDEPDGQIRVGDEWLNVDQCRLNRERFLMITTIPNTRAFRTMEDWIETLPNGKPKESFLFTVGQPRPFARFREALKQYPLQAKQWFEYEEKANLVYVQMWLEENGVIPEDLWDEEIHGRKAVHVEPEHEDSLENGPDSVELDASTGVPTED